MLALSSFAPYSVGMQSVAQLEASIQMLPAQDFLVLAEWFSEQHMQRRREDGFEPPELEAEMVKALDGPRHEVNEAFFAELKRSW